MDTKSFLRLTFKKSLLLLAPILVTVIISSVLLAHGFTVDSCDEEARRALCDTTPPENW